MKDTRDVEIAHAFTERTTFVAPTLSSNDDKISPEDHVEKSLAAVKQLATAKPGVN
jgi:hypothetical protein